MTNHLLELNIQSNLNLAQPVEIQARSPEFFEGRGPQALLIQLMERGILMGKP